MSCTLNTCPTSQEKSDMFVTSLDVFSRRAYFDPYTTHTNIEVLPPIPPLPKAQSDKLPVGVVFPNAHTLDSGADQDVAVHESLVSKVKHFSTPSSFKASNLVADFLKENLGGAILPDDRVGRHVLLERRRSFFESLFTIEEHVQTALPCRLSTSDIENIFRSDSDTPLNSTESYRKRLASLEQLRTTLNC
ncbi:hypothetical protein, conserved [Leishmania tarentolae]|uniref:Uncharacterized protein n=1 Tax=Leishmania tarentolae TaxID=5689 RepID=A0A640KR48_LEITA|nr:hypothetical protein, conserved [Leishmania tarentolae]